MTLRSDHARVMNAVFEDCGRHIRYVAIFSALLNLLFIAPMLYMLQVYDRVVPTRGLGSLTLLTAALIAALATLSLLDYLRSRLLIRASIRFDKVLAVEILNASLSAGAQDSQVARQQAIREFDLLRQTLTGGAILALCDAPWVPIYLLICFLIHPLVGLLATAGGVLLLLLAWRNEVATRDRLLRASDAAGKAYAGHEQVVSASPIVRALGMRRALVARHMHEREAMLRLQMEASFGSAPFVSASKFLRLLLQSLVLGLGAMLAIDQQISPGAIFASVFMLGRALQPIDQLVATWKSIVQARGACRTLSELLDGHPPVVAPTQLPSPRGGLSLENVAIFVPGRDHPVLDRITFTVEAGEVVGIIGPSGAGKSTLLQMIAGAAPPAQGSIRFDGAEQRDWDPERLAPHIGYMPQEPGLFAGTIKHNISRFQAFHGGELAAVDAECIRAARCASAHELILGLPNGYDYQLGAGGRGLSMGQAQRVALARALYGSPAYLLLDEPNAHLDAEGERRLLGALGELKDAGTTVLTVVHRLTVLPVIDRLLVLRDGRIQCFGPREDVLAMLAGKPLPASGARLETAA